MVQCIVAEPAYGPGDFVGLNYYSRKYNVPSNRQINVKFGARIRPTRRVREMSYHKIMVVKKEERLRRSDNNKGSFTAEV